jgi:hypothetical protein
MEAVSLDVSVKANGQGTALPTLNSSSPIQGFSCGLAANNKDKKPRKKYTVTKPRENWSEEEHQKFLDGLRLYFLLSSYKI